MDNMIEEIFRAFLRGIGYILAEIFFGTICYWVGWPVCKLLSLGRYPSSNNLVYLDDEWPRPHSNNSWCAAVGLLIIIFAGLYFLVNSHNI